MKNTKNKSAKMQSILSALIRSICAIALVAVIGFWTVSCEDDDGNGNGSGNGNTQKVTKISFYNANGVLISYYVFEYM